MKKYKGIAAASGIGKGNVFCYTQRNFKLKEYIYNDIINENKIFDFVFKEVKKDIQVIINKTKNNIGKEEASIFEAHLMIMDDPELLESIKEKINEGKGAYNSVFLTFDKFIDLFSKIESEYMRERAKDLIDIKNQILLKIEGKKQIDLSELPNNTILFADDLLPSNIAILNTDNVNGFVTRIGGKTSHIAIMARTIGIPAIVGVLDLPNIDGLFLVMNGDDGTLILEPDQDTILEYDRLKKENLEKKRNIEKFAFAKTLTASGKHFSIASNIGSDKDLEGAISVGSEGIGLYRTEFLFMDRKTSPTEDEQYESYTKVLSAFLEHKVVIRTLDIGGDKNIPYMNFQKELNPFLGYRAIRYCLDHIDVFKTQLRALLRASIHGKLAVMIPMISTLEEIYASRKIFEEVKIELNNENINFDKDVEFGIMIEVPHAAIMADVLAEHVDFFSIGTNDLIQYTIAADRSNQNVYNLYSQYQPGVLRLIANVVKFAKDKGIWIGMCGEAAADESLLPLWVSLGFDELSMSYSSVLKIRSLTSKLDENNLTLIKERVLKSKDKKEVEEILRITSLY